MADILTQDEIDRLLDVVEDESNSEFNDEFTQNFDTTRDGLTWLEEFLTYMNHLEVQGTLKESTCTLDANILNRYLQKLNYFSENKESILNNLNRLRNENLNLKNKLENCEKLSKYSLKKNINFN
jgi:hypothetical protein